MRSRARIAASILNADQANLAREVRRAERAGADRIHLDVMDNHFVPNLTFGAATIRDLRRVTRLPFDAHLMIEEPGRFIGGFLEAGCDSVTIHVEITEEIRPTLEAIRAAGRGVGLAVRPATPLAALEPYRELLDIVMVMTVEPGFGGQTFLREPAAAKIPAARNLLSHRPWGGEIHVDGGVNRESAEFIGGLGADILIAGSALYARGRDIGREVRLIRALADEGYAEKLNEGRPPRPRDAWMLLGRLPRPFGAALAAEIEAGGVPVILLRGDGQINPDGVRDYDLLIPEEAGPYVTERWGGRLERAEADAQAWRLAYPSGGQGQRAGRR